MKLDMRLGDCRDVLPQLAAGSVHCCVTSPPYWGLRDYGTATWEGGSEGCDHDCRRREQDPDSKSATNEGSARDPIRAASECRKCGARRIDSQIGLEATPEEYVAKIVEVFRAVRRVLRDDGTLWLNMGDCYNGVGRGDKANGLQVAARATVQRTVIGLKPKDLVGMPWRVAFALQADGWYLRSDIIEEVELYCPCGCGYVMEERIWRHAQDREIIWHKKNPMPESCTDRPTKSHEYLFLLTKQPRYFYDADAIREPTGNELSWEEYGDRTAPGETWQSGMPDGMHAGSHKHDGGRSHPSGRNKRSVWTIATQAYPKAHFATFPEALVLPCILAGTSEEGCCAECGAPWERVVEVSEEYKDWAKTQRYYGEGGKGSAFREAKTNSHTAPIKGHTTGWQPTCTCDAAAVPCTVLDPFLGSGTTAKVAQQYGRSFVGCELSAEYLELARDRFKQSRLFA